MSEPQPLWERYLHMLQRFGTPEEIGDVLDDLGRPAKVKERNAEIAAMLEARKRTRWFFALARDTAAWIVGVGAAIAMAYGAYTFLHTTVLPPAEPPAETRPAEEPHR